MTNNTFKFTKEDIAAAVEKGITPDTLAQQYADLLNEVVAENSKNAKKKEKIADMQFVLDAVINFINTWYKTAENAEALDSLMEELNDAEIWVDAIDNEVVPALESISKLNEFIKKFNVDTGANYPLFGASADLAKTNYAKDLKGDIPLKINFKDPKATTAAKMSNDEIIDNFLAAFNLK
jgi:hypothetical protein